MSTTFKELTTIPITLSKLFCEQFSCEDKPRQNQILGVLKQLRDGEHSNGLNLETFEGNHQLFSCRYNDKERLILQRHNDGWYVQQLMDDHKYPRVKTKEIKPHQTLSEIESEVSSSADCSDVQVSPAIFVEPHFFGKFTLTQEQQAVCHAHFPIILSGGAGSGKSLVLCQRAEDLLRTFSNEDDKVLLLTVPRLVGVVSEEWKSSKAYDRRLEICCYADLFGSQVEHDKIDEWLSCDEQKEIHASIRANIKQQFDIISTCIDQAEYLKRDGVSEEEKQSFWALFERYKQSPQSKDSVAHDKIEEWLSGDGRRHIPDFVGSNAIIKQEFDIISACDNQADYLKLGAKQSYVASEEEKKSLWALFDRYKGSRQSKVDLRYQSFDLEKKFTAVFVDESQIYSHAQLRNIRELGTGLNFIWAFDNSQNAFSSYSPESFIRSMFKGQHISDLELSSSFRCPKQILDIANKVKDVQHFLVGNQSKKSSSEQSNVSEEHSGSVSYMEPNDEFQVENNLYFAVCTPLKFYEEAKLKFPNCLVLLPAEAPGLEFETVLLWRVLEDDGFDKIAKMYSRQTSAAKNRSPVRSQNVEISPLLSNLYVAITRAKSNLVICTEQSHIPKIRVLWSAFGLEQHPSIPAAKLPQPPEFAKENRTPNTQRIAELRRYGISEEDISRMVGTHSQQKTEPFCAGGGASTLTMFKPSQSSSPLPLLKLCEAESKKVHVELIALVPEDVKKLIGLCFSLEKQKLTPFLKRMLEKCTSAGVLASALKLNIKGSTMESFIKDDKDRCQSFMMAIHQLDEVSFSQDHKYRVLRDLFNQNDALLNQLISLMCSDFEFYDGKLSRLISKDAPPNKQNLWQPFQRIKSKLSEYRSKVRLSLSDIPTPLIFALFLRKDFKMLQELIEIGADLEREVAKNGITPLILAIRTGYIDALELLLEKRADLNKGCSLGNTPLMHAIESDNISALKILLKTGVDKEKGNNDGVTPILKAIRCENLQALQLLINAGANIHQSESDEYNPLLIAIKLKYHDGIKLLLDAKADPNQLFDNIPPIVMAISTNNTTVLELLLKAGANPDLSCHNGVSPLMFAIQENHLSSVDLLLQAGANPNLSCHNGVSPLSLAIRKNKPKSVNLLLKAGANPDLSYHNGVSPLMLAIQENQIENLQLLLRAGANLNQTDSLGGSPLIHALKFDNLEALQLLITSGADVNQKNSLGQTPLDFAIGMTFFTNNTKVFQLLLQAGAKPNLSCVHGVSPLMLAIQEKEVSIVDLLLQSDADPNLSCVHGVTPLMLAIEKNELSNVDLLQACTKPNLSSDHGVSPLILAIQNFEDENIELLLGAGAELNQTDDFGDSALMHAVKCDNPAAVKLLIEYGADVNQKNSQGQTPLDIAIDLNNFATIMLLGCTTFKPPHFS